MKRITKSTLAIVTLLSAMSSLAWAHSKPSKPCVPGETFRRPDGSYDVCPNNIDPNTPAIDVLKLGMTLSLTSTFKFSTQNNYIDLTDDGIWTPAPSDPQDRPYCILRLKDSAWDHNLAELGPRDAAGNPHHQNMKVLSSQVNARLEDGAAMSVSFVLDDPSIDAMVCQIFEEPSSKRALTIGDIFKALSPYFAVSYSSLPSV